MLEEMGDVLPLCLERKWAEREIVAIHHYNRRWHSYVNENIRIMNGVVKYADENYDRKFTFP